MSTRGWFVWMFAVLAACGGRSSDQPGPGHSPKTPPQGACGVRLFRTDACQTALDSVCCALEIQCANDPGCAQLLQCVNGCKAGGNTGHAAENCINGCAIQSRVAFCQAACRGGPADCLTRCSHDGSLAEPSAKLQLVANCSKGVHYPQGVTCDDDS